ncbi:uncharacterized protein Z518_08209 [Rhinocladiella mackenziei CBS 650.93]|uniref:Rhodopsin domain-containing protein n=1 Tax=Rhinocladiella mackenziei CBS 650.93 TaxID=1442369 RepID=A0A0D2J050_9EURO|nr:uncharacterized protein Z518_08209 [Rhinocladiella mackenziei CBS 650.93]KIX02270.1 hypothetical protein Z518_08209 [Rhinocladiella mackenziei CBS 650.93]
MLHIAATFWAINHGYGLPLREIEEAHVGIVEKALFASQLSYVGSLGLTRMSTAFFIEHLTRYRVQVRLSYILAAVSGVWTTASILVIALRPDIAHPWATLDGAEVLYVRWIAVETTGLAVEVVLWMLSVSLVWGLQMKIQKRVLILVAFGCRLLLIPVVAIRLRYLSPDENHDPTFTSILAHILTEGALEYALISTSITSLKPFLKPFHTGAIVNTVGGSGSGLYSGSHSATQGIYMLSSIARDKKGNGQTTTATVHSGNSDSGPPPRSKLYVGNISEGTTTVSSQPDPHRDDTESAGSNSSGQMIIRTTKEWAVRYENRV